MATIQVRIYDTAGRPIDGTVHLDRQGYQPFVCRSRGGRCQINNVPPAVYTVTVTPTRGQRPPARTFHVPRNRGTFVISIAVPSGPRKATAADLLRRQLDRCRVENMLLRARQSRAPTPKSLPTIRRRSSLGTNAEATVGTAGAFALGVATAALGFWLFGGDKAQKSRIEYLESELRHERSPAARRAVRKAEEAVRRGRW